MQYFSSAEAGGNVQACYQLGVMFYDGLGAHPDPVNCYVAGRCMTSLVLQKKGFQCMIKAAQSGNQVSAGAQYNIGRAFYQVTVFAGQCTAP